MDPGRAERVDRLVDLIERALRAYLDSGNPESGGEVRPGEEVEGLVERALEERWDLQRLEKQYILRVLEETGGNRTRAAEILGIDRRTVYRKLKQYESGSEG